MEMTVASGMVKVADWSDQMGFVPTRINSGDDRSQARLDYERNRTYIVTTIIEEPYLMLRKGKPGKVLEGNELYEGYCKDLADMIAHKLGINCKFLSSCKCENIVFGAILKIQLKNRKTHFSFLDKIILLFCFLLLND